MLTKMSPKFSILTMDVVISDISNSLHHSLNTEGNTTARLQCSIIPCHTTKLSMKKHPIILEIA
jgi:hypothetical protein